jgi:predicted amidohydrolase/CubicO group peptidase (beta-lactamase class C family)
MKLPPALARSMTVLLALAAPAPRVAADPGTAYPGETWEEVAPEAAGLDPGRLKLAVRFLEEHAGRDGVKELVIVRGGRIVWKGESAGRRHGVWSCTKSFTTTVLGLLVADGKCALETRAAEVLPVLAAAYPDATLRHFASMTSGYRARGDEPRGSYRHGPSETPFDPAEPLFAPPGSRYAYWDSAMNQLGNLLTRIARESIADLFRRRVAERIGMRDWEWGDLGDVDGIRAHGGAGNHDKHVRISSLELARFGHLLLQRGRWRDEQLLPAAWVDIATSVHVPAAHPLAGEPIDGRGVYGLGFWTNGLRPDGRRQWPGAPIGTFAALGHNNNCLLVVPEWDVVAVRLGTDEGDRKITAEDIGEFLRLVGEAIPGESANDPRPGLWRLAAPRAEIAPAAWRDGTALVDGLPALVLAGRGSEAVDGAWTRRFAVETGTHVLFEARYTSERVEEPLRSILARVLFRDAAGKLDGQPEYPATLEGAAGGAGTIRQTYRVPAGAVLADVELSYRWDADGLARFGAVRLERTETPPPRKVRLATVHHRPRGSEGPRANVEAFADLVRRAAREKADIVCLPEGITVVGTGKTYADVAEPVPGPSTERLAEVARECGLYIAAGIYERDGTAVYNTALLLAPEGKLLGKYRKVCLPREEIEGGIMPGSDLPVFDTRFGRVGMMVCWDVFFPEPARALAAKGAEVILLPIWGGNLTLARARAIENQVYLVSSSYDMKTAVFDRAGEVIAEGADDRPVVVVEVDLAERTLWPWLGDFGARIPRERASARALRLGAVPTREAALATIERLGGRVFRESGRVIEVDLARTAVTDADLALIARLEDITDLNLEETAIGDEGVAHLSSLEKLEWLNLYRTRVGDDGLGALKRVRSLKHLPAGETRVTDAGLVHLAEMPWLVYLGLRGNRVTDAGLERLKGLTGLTGLHLGQTDVTVAGLRSVEGHAGLRKLWLPDTRIGDDAVPILARLGKLEELHIQRTDMTAAGVERLEAALPACRVQYRSE